MLKFAAIGVLGFEGLDQGASFPAANARHCWLVHICTLVCVLQERVADAAQSHLKRLVILFDHLNFGLVRIKMIQALLVYPFLRFHMLFHVCKGAVRAIMVVYHFEVHHAFAEDLVNFGEER